MLPRLRNAVGWLAATAAAVAIAHAGVSAVAGRVVDPLPPAVGMAEAATTPDVAADDATPTPSPPTTAGPSPTPSATTAAPSDRTGASSGLAGPADDPGEDVPPPSPASSSSPSAQPTAASSTSTSPTAAPEVRSYALVGGTATLRFEPGRVTVLAAEPAQGFSLEVEGDGSPEVRVEFENDSHRSRLRGTWEDGPEDRVEEDGRSEEHDEEDD